MSKNLFSVFSLIVSLQTYSQGYVTSVPLKLKEPINTSYNELSPVFYVDSTTVYFTRNSEQNQYKGFLNQDIWVSRQEKVGVWSEATPVKELNNQLNNSVLGFNADGTKVYLLDSYNKNKTYVDGIAVSEKLEGKWTEPKHLPVEGLLVDGDFCGFTINKEENVIVMSYKGPLSLGEEDLYVSFKQENEVWSVPVHLGEGINSEGFEISPFLTYDSDTLYFSSNGRGGFGDADIFFSVRLDDTWQNWSKPKNLGATINSPGFDAYLHSIGNRVFWSSDREMKGNEDIFYVQKIKPPKLKVDVTETKSVSVFHGQDGKVQISVSGGVEPYTYLWSDGSTSKDLENVPDGEYLVVVTDAVDQEVTLKAIVSTPKIKEGEDLAVLFDPPVVIYYDLDKYSITKESTNSIERVIEVLNENPNVKIEVRSYTDCQGDELYNLQLSKSRSKATVDYLKSKVKNPERIVGKGFGETMLVIDCDCNKNKCSEEDHQKNRRTEFVVVK
jgi:OmpA-OmpF porin, OOP family